MTNNSLLLRFIIASFVAIALTVGLIANARTENMADAPGRDAYNSIQEKRAELPAEWRWQRKAQTFNGMFRQRR